MAVCAQVWEFDAVAPGYLSNSIPDGNPGTICLNSNGCTQDLIYYQCVTSGGTCCGPDCYQGLQFVLNADGTLTCPLPGLAGLCVAANADHSSLGFATCAPSAPEQQWEYSAASGALKNAGAAACLTSSLTPPMFYVQMCARVTGAGVAGLNDLFLV